MLKMFWPFSFTSAARGARDRKQDHPSQDAAVTMRIHEGDGDTTAHFPFFGALVVADAEMASDQLLVSFEKRRHRLKAEAEKLANEVRDLLSKLLSLKASRDGKHDTRRPCFGIGIRTYLLYLIGIGLAEYAFNRRAFNGWFAESDSLATFLQYGWQIWVVALLPSFVLPLSGHLIGGWLKHFRRERMRLTDMIVLLVTLAGAGGIVWTLSSLRAADHARYFKGESSAFLEMMAVNIAALAMGIALAYLRHGDDADHEDSDKQQRVLERHLTRKNRRWVKVAGRHDALRGVAIQRVDAIRDRALCKIYEYADHNLRGAKAPISPALVDEVGHRFFRRRDFGTALSLNPPTITEIIEEGRPTQHASAPNASGNEIGTKPNGRDPENSDTSTFPNTINPKEDHHAH